MKKTKRLSAMLLALCLVLSMALPTVWAEGADTVVYNFDYYAWTAENNAQTVLNQAKNYNAFNDTLNAEIAQYYEEALNWKFKEYSSTWVHPTDPANTNRVYLYSKAYRAKTTHGFMRFNAMEGDWIAFTVKNPGKNAKWELSLTHVSSKSGAETGSVYILPGDTQDISTALTNVEAIGSTSFFDETVGSADAPNTPAVNSYIGQWETGEAEEYILVLQASKNNSTTQSAYMYLSQIDLVPAVEDIPSVDPVSAESAYEAIIPSYTPMNLATGQVDGHAYVYITFKGTRLFVYDVDTDELVDNILLGGMSHPRCIYVDQDGIVWVGGSGSKLFRYDPYTKTKTEIKIPYSTVFPKASSFNIYSLTGDENGYLYFGTYNAGYLGMYNTKTGEFFCLSDGMLGEDAMYSAWGGMHIKNGYAYLCINGDKNSDGVQTHELIKFNLTTKKIDARFNIADRMGKTKYLSGLNMLGDLLIASVADQMIVLDTNTMLETTFEGLENRFFGQISTENNGKVYLMDRDENGGFGRGLLEYDLASKTLTPVCSTSVGSLVGRQCAVEIDGLPGISLVTYRTAENGVNLTVYNPASGETRIVENVTKSEGCGNVTRALAGTPDGKTIFVGAYGINKLAIYDVATGQRTGLFNTYSHQIEGLIWYENNLYIGNYNQGVLTKFDVQTGTATPLMVLDSTTAFAQVRMNAMAAGDGMVFVGTAPDQYKLGGVLTWYNIEENRIYVAAGPNPEDVYYTVAGLLDAEGKQITQIWYSAVTGQPAAFDEDGDGKDDNRITVNGESVQRFTGVIKNQSINAIVYQDGYIIGSTTQSGGSGSEAIASVNARLFIYDIENMRLVKTLDLAEAIPGLTTPVPFGDAIAADPDIEGKYWGVVSDTLFSFTFDFKAGQFSVKEELSLGKEKYNHGNNLWQSRNIVFDGDFMYVVFGTYGTYMVNREDPSCNYQLSVAVPNQTALGTDGNLYFYNNDNTLDLQVLKIAEAVQPILDPYEAANIQAMIDAMDDAANITLEDEAAVLAVRAAYNTLSEAGKAMVNADKLIAAEAVIAPLRAAVDKAAADTVIAKIEAIGTVTPESKAAIAEARTSFDALTASQKALVTNANVLTAAESALHALNQAAADAVIAKINAIGTVTLDSESAIVAARVAYDALSEDQKLLVSNLNVLTAAEDNIEKLNDPDENPKTGDVTALAVFAGILVASAAAIFALLPNGSKKTPI